MRSMTGYGRGESECAGTKVNVEVNSVNRKQSDVVINLPRELAALEPRIRQAVNERVVRGRTNVVVALQISPTASQNVPLDRALARSYHDAMRSLQAELTVAGEITIGMILQAPGVLRYANNALQPNDVWPAVEEALSGALGELIKMRER